MSKLHRDRRDAALDALALLRHLMLPIFFSNREGGKKKRGKEKKKKRKEGARGESRGSARHHASLMEKKGGKEWRIVPLASPRNIHGTTLSSL